MYDYLWFTYEIAHNWKALIPIFQECSLSISKTFTFTRRLGTQLSFYGN